MDLESSRKVIDISIDDILPNRYQPRLKFEDDSIFELAESIKVHGVFQPILVRPIGDKYEIIAGERRYKASVLANRKTIPAIVVSLNDKDAVEIALIENVQRSNLTAIEEAVSYKRILDMGYIKQEDLARKLGKNQSTIANKLRLLNLDEDVQEALQENKISERHARSLLRLKSSMDQKIMLKRIINERLTVRRTDEEIDKMVKENDNKPVTPIVIEESFSDDTFENNDVDNDFEIPEVVPQKEEVFGFTDDSISNINVAAANPSTVISSDPMEEVENIEVADADIDKIEEVAAPVYEEKPVYEKPELLRPEIVEEKEEEEEVETPPVFTGKFFNFAPIVQEEEKPVNSDESFKFDNFVETKNEPSEASTAPSFDDFFKNQTTTTLTDEVPTPTDYDNFKDTAAEVMGNDTLVVPNNEEKNVTKAIDIIKEAIDKLKNLGYNVDVDELDLESIYQLIIKIDK